MAQEASREGQERIDAEGKKEGEEKEEKEEDESLWKSCRDRSVPPDPNEAADLARENIPCSRTLGSARGIGIHRLLSGLAGRLNFLFGKLDLCEYHRNKLKQFATGKLTEQNCHTNYQILKFVYHFYFDPLLKRCEKNKWFEVAREEFGITTPNAQFRLKEVLEELERDFGYDEELLEDWDPFSPDLESGS